MNTSYQVPRIKKRAMALAISLALVTGSSLGYTYSINRAERENFKVFSYNTIIPTDSPLRNSPTSAGVCSSQSGGFSPAPSTCINSVPVPSTYLLFLTGLVTLIILKRGGAR